MASRFSKLITCSLLTFAVAIPLSSCSFNQKEVAYQASSLEFTNRNLVLNVGDRQVLKYSISPASAKDAPAYWFSNNESVAYVTQGVVMGVGQGTAKISLVTAGLSATIEVKVIDIGGGDVESIVLSTNAMNLNEGSSAPLKAYTNPASANVTWSTSDASVAEYSGGNVTGKKIGSATITATLDSGLSASCLVTVKESTSPTPGPDGGKGYTGKIRIGAPMGEMDFVKGLEAGFNAATGSSVTFEVTQWEEGNGADNLPQSLGDGPDIFPYVSDQTIAFFQRNALASLPASATKFIKNNMGEEALSYARLNGTNKYIGYPFASDNGYVMFYSKSLAATIGFTDETIKNCTMEELLTAAKSKGSEYKIDFPITNAFYAAGSLMSYNHNAANTECSSLYKLTMKSGGTSYSVNSSFDSEVGVKAAKQIRKLFEFNANLCTDNRCPGSKGASTKVVATIVDCSKVSAFSLDLGSDYGVAPLPYIDSEKTCRYANYLGYKFYGINPTKAADHIDMAHDVAQYLVGEEVQAKRFNQLKIKPTFTSLLNAETHPEIMNEPHIKALEAQGKANTVKLTAVDTSLWSEAAVAIKSIKNLAISASDAEYKSILSDFDTNIYQA